LGGIEPHATREGTFGMAIQVRAESLRSPAQERMVKEIYGRLAGLIRRMSSAPPTPAPWPL
jgi:hypothetical protein